MTSNPLDYPRMVQDALRWVVRRSLEYVQHHGLPGEHHFYLAFSTVAPGVGISEDLRRRYPEQITIVLQHDFRELEVDGDFFAVTLRFGGVPQRIRVPFSAMISFYDPVAQFALRFDPEVDEAGERRPVAEDSSSRAAVRAVLAAADRLAAEKEEAQRKLSELVGEDEEEPSSGLPRPPTSRRPPVPPLEEPAMPEADGDREVPANVVSIDAFRRK